MAANSFFNRQNSLTIILLIIVCSILTYTATNFIKNKNAESTAEKFNPAFDMIDPLNPTTKLDRILRLKKETDVLDKEIKLIDKIKSGIDGIVFPATVPVLDKDGTITNEAYKFWEDLSPVRIFQDWVFENYPRSGEALESETLIKNSLFQYTNTYRNNLATAHVLPAIIERNVNPYYDSRYDTVALIRFTDPDSSRLYTLIQTAVTAKTKLSADLSKRRDEIIPIISTNRKNYNDEITEYSKGRYDINSKAITWGITAFVITALVMYIVGIRSRSKMRLNAKDSNDPNVHEDVKVSMWYSVYMITVLLLIITIFILGLARILTDSSLAALLGGIAGYVLNNKMGDTAKATAAGTSAAPQGNPIPITAQTPAAPSPEPIEEPTSKRQQSDFL